VENVLLHTRGELRDARLDLQPVDVGEVVREVVATMDAAAAAQRSRLRAVTPPALEATADAGALRQVLLNLLDNALRYGPEGQTVTLTVTPPRAAGDPLVLTVDDEGTGIPPAERRRVWTPFVRLGDRGGATGGTGLGLSVVRALVHQHGGRVDVGDAPGGGARFLVTLPSRPPGR
jgi:signal transduction histidine kinase